jgi:hypothetical protein
MRGERGQSDTSSMGRKVEWNESGSRYSMMSDSTFGSNKAAESPSSLLRLPGHRSGADEEEKEEEEEEEDATVIDDSSLWDRADSNASPNASVMNRMLFH